MLIVLLTPSSLVAQVAEGVDTAFALVDLIKAKSKGYRLDLKYPIIFGVRNILEGKLDAIVADVRNASADAPLNCSATSLVQSYSSMHNFGMAVKNFLHSG